jgi:hypothetical protein
MDWPEVPFEDITPDNALVVSNVALDPVLA